MAWPNTTLIPWLAALTQGQVCAAPAEGVYGYVADPFNPKALQTLLELKQRDSKKGLICLVPSPSVLAKICPANLPQPIKNAIATYWQTPHPQPVTLILPALSTLDKNLTGHHATIAVRMPQNATMQTYLQAWQATSGHGVLVSTSLNLAGEPPATHASQIPSGIPSLTVPQTLSGTPSRIFSPLDDTWLR